MIITDHNRQEKKIKILTHHPSSPSWRSCKTFFDGLKRKESLEVSPIPPGLMEIFYMRLKQINTHFFSGKPIRGKLEIEIFCIRHDPEIFCIRHDPIKYSNKCSESYLLNKTSYVAVVCGIDKWFVICYLLFVVKQTSCS